MNKQEIIEIIKEHLIKSGAKKIFNLWLLRKR